MATASTATSVTQEDLKAFYAGRKKRPANFGYSPDGNLVFYGSKGIIEKTIVLPSYRTPTIEEISTNETRRLEEIARLQEQFENAREALRESLALSMGESAGADAPTTSRIVQLNTACADAEGALMRVRYPLRFIKTIESIAPQEILFGSQDTLKLEDVSLFRSRPFTLEEQWVRTGASTTTELSTKVQTNITQNSRPIQLFGSSSDNFLALEWPVTFLFRGTSYRSAKHALFGELAKEFKDDAMLAIVLKEEDPMAIEYNYSDVPDATEDSWNSRRSVLIQDILREKFGQHPELSEKLVQTGESHLGAVVDGDTLFGIGLAIGDPNSLNPLKWTGQNLLGKVHEQIRTEIRDLRRKLEAEAVAQATAAPAPAPAPPVRRRFTLKKKVTVPST
jgi:ribA/ribD-fused uncharacterized protein